MASNSSGPNDESQMNTIGRSNGNGSREYNQIEGQIESSETNGLLSREGDDEGGGESRSTMSKVSNQVNSYWNSFTASISHLISNTKSKARFNSNSNPNSNPRSTEQEELPSTSSSHSPTLGQRFHFFKSKHPYILSSIITFLLLILLFILFYSTLIIHLIFFTLSPPSSSIQSQILNSSILLKGPDSISLLNVSESGILVSLTGRLGLDPDKALDLYLGQKKDLGWLKRKERSWIEWSIGEIGGVVIETGEMKLAEPDWKLDLKPGYLGILDPKAKRDEEKDGSAASIYRKNQDKEDESLPPHPPLDLLSFNIQPLVIPLPNLSSHGKNHSSSILAPGGIGKEPILGGDNSTHKTHQTLHPLNLTLLLKPVSPAPQIMEFVKKSIDKKKIVMDLNLESLRVRGIKRSQMAKENEKMKIGGGIAGWLDVRQKGIVKRLAERVPKFKKDPDEDTGDFLNLTRYDFFEINAGLVEGSRAGCESVAALPSFNSEDSSHSIGTSDGPRALGIKAVAEAKNPLGKILHGHVGYHLPLGIFLPVEQSDDLGSIPSAKKKNDSTVLLAAVATQPLTITGEKLIQLEILGRVVPPPTGKSQGSAKTVPDPSPDETKDVKNMDGWGKVVSQLIFGEAAVSDPKEISSPGLSTDADDRISIQEDTPQQIALSGFLSRFLRGDPNTVYVRGGSPFHVEDPINSSSPIGTSTNSISSRSLPGDGSILPPWLDSSLRLIDLPISFPGSKVTELIKNLTIQDLKITPHPFEKEKLLASGTIFGEINLPGQLATIDVQITDLWPDILVYNGKPPALKKGKGGKKPDDGTGDGDDDDEEEDEDDEGDNGLDFNDNFNHPNEESSTHYENPNDAPSDPVPPLPAPNSKTAFGRVRPHDFSPAETIPDPNDPTGEKKLLRSELKNVPFTVLEGKGPIFRSFTWKLLTGEGALAGIQGASRAKIWNSGLGKLELKNLPVKGAFVVGKRGGNGGDDDDDDD